MDYEIVTVRPVAEGAGSSSESRSTRRGLALKVLVTTNHLSAFAGGALVAMEVASALRDLGHLVDICAGYVAPPLEDRINSLNLSCRTFAEIPSVYDYDLIWAQNHIFPALLASSRLTAVPLPRILAVSLSPYEPLEMPGAIVDLAERVIANSQETADQLLGYGVDAKKLYVFDNAAPVEFMTLRPPIQALKSILAVANHAPAELEESFELIRKAGLTVNRIGIPHGQTAVTPDLIRQHDAVVTIGKTVQYSIQSETPVYIYDRFGGPGWLSLENAKVASYYNFSGRCSRRKISAEIIRDEILKGHASAAREIAAIKRLYGDRFNLTKRLTEIIEGGENGIAIDQESIDRVRREGVLAKEVPRLYGDSQQINMLKSQILELKKGIEARDSIIRNLSIDKFELGKLVDKLSREAES